MATRVDFYLIPEDVERVVCRLIEKIVEQKHAVYIQCADSASLAVLDDRLWTFRDISFLPHQRYSPTKSIEAPVLLGCDSIPKNMHGLLMNISHQWLPAYTQFERVLEMVPPDETLRTKARERFAQYRAAGCELHKHDLVAQ